MQCNLLLFSCQTNVPQTGQSRDLRSGDTP